MTTSAKGADGRVTAPTGEGQRQNRPVSSAGWGRWGTRARAPLSSSLARISHRGCPPPFRHHLREPRHVLHFAPAPPPRPVVLPPRPPRPAPAPVGVATSAQLRMYSVNPLTGAATVFGNILAGTVPGAGDVDTGYDFNPTVDRIRVVNENNANFRLNPNNGTLAGSDTNLTFVPPAIGPEGGLAYDRHLDRA